MRPMDGIVMSCHLFFGAVFFAGFAGFEALMVGFCLPLEPLPRLLASIDVSAM
jgi:hypothetical protein